jgi:hypothetical protein
MNHGRAVNNNKYQVDTVLPSGEIQEDLIPCWGAFSLGKDEDKEFLIKEMLPKLKGISILGVGITEAGLASKDTRVMQDLYSLFQAFHTLIVRDKIWSLETGKLCIINMDNVPNNGDTIRTYMEELATGDPKMLSFFNTKVVFMNTMVDRITSHRDGNANIPKSEPMPTKALVVLDENQDLPSSFGKQAGVVIRSTKDELQMDIALKLRIANGTHTAIAHVLALLKHLKTDVLSTNEPGDLMMDYLDMLLEEQIVPATLNETEALEVYEDWRRRLVHPHFGLSSFFITQNGSTKGGIRWGPTVVDLVQNGIAVQWSFAFAYAVLLRWLTPAPGSKTENGVSTGWLDGMMDLQNNLPPKDDDSSIEYADGLRYHLKHGWYEFKCPLENDGTLLTESLRQCINKAPNECCDVIRLYLLSPEGGNLDSVKDKIEDLIQAIAYLYSQMVTKEVGVSIILKELSEGNDRVGFSTPCRHKKI